MKDKNQIIREAISDRDVHAANNMIMFYKLKTSPSGTDGHACGATNCEARSLSCL